MNPKPKKRTSNTIAVLRLLATLNSSPVHKLNQKIIQSRSQFQLTNRITRTPHPNQTHHVIYIAFSKRPKDPERYVGKTSRTCFDRRNTEISQAFQSRTYDLPLSKFIRKIGAENYILIPLQTVHKWEEAHFHERYWINRFRSNCYTNPHGLNVSHEHRYNPPTLSFTKPQSPDISPHHAHNHTSRDIYKKLTSLRHHLNSNTSSTYVEKLSMKNLQRLIAVFTKQHPNPLNQPSKFTDNIPLYHQQALELFSQQEIPFLVMEINQQIKHRLFTPKEKKKQSIPTISITHSSSILGKIQLTSTINQKIKQYFPHIPHQSARIVFKNPPNLQLLLCNYNQEVRNLQTVSFTNLKPKETECNCHFEDCKPFLNKHGHISSSDPAVIYTLIHPGLNATYDLISKGTTFIDKPHTSIQKIIPDISQSIDKFCSKILRYTSIIAIQSFKSDLINTITAQLQSIPLQEKPRLAQPHVQNCIKLIKNQFIITPTDKMPKNFNFTCKVHWLQALHNSLNLYPIIDLDNRKIQILNNQQPPSANTPLPPTHPSFHQLPGHPKFTIRPPPHFHIPTTPPPSESYKKTNQTPAQIIQAHKKYLNQFKITCHDKLPTKALLFKQHKTGIRPLVTAYNTTTTNLSKFLAQALNAVLFQLKKKYPDCFTPLKSSIDLANHLSVLNITPNYEPNYIRSKDISGCYDNIEHTDLKYVINTLIPEIFNYTRFKHLKITKYGAVFTNEHKTNSKSTIFLSEHQLKTLLIWKIDNTIIQYGHTTLRQIIGIAQGDNHSPQLCNLYLSFYEIQFLQYIKQNFKSDFFLLSLTRRNIDDTIFFSPYADQITYLTPTQIGIYPKIYLTLTSADIHPFEETKFLDFHIKSTNNPLHQLSVNTQLLKPDEVKNLLTNLSLPITKYNYKNLYTLNHYINKTKSLQPKQKIWTSITYQKTDEFPTQLKPIRFTHYTSHLPPSVKRAIVTSRLHSFTITNINSLDNFLTTVRNTIQSLNQKYQYPKTLLFKSLIQFLKKKKSIYNYSYRQIRQILFTKFHSLITLLKQNRIPRDVASSYCPSPPLIHTHNTISTQT